MSDKPGKNILLTGGRAPATLDLARQCVRNGHRVVCAESVRVHLCSYSKLIEKNYLVPVPNKEPDGYIEALIEIIQKEQIDILIPTCEEIFFVSCGLERLQHYTMVFVMPLSCLRQLHSKWEFIQLAKQSGFAVPVTALITSQEEAQAYIKEYREGQCKPFVLKPVFSRFSTKVIVVEDLKKAERALQQITISPQTPWVAQERIKGKAFSTYSVAQEGKILAHVVYAENFTAGRGACIDFTPSKQPEIDRWVTDFVQRIHFSGQIAFDFMVTAEGKIFPLECNPRATSGIHLFRPEANLIACFFQDRSQNEYVLRPDPATKKMIVLAMILFGLSQVHSWQRLIAWVRTCFRSQDVLFDCHDLRPFFAQLSLVLYNWRHSRQLRISMLEYSTYDIEWNGQN